MSRRRRRSVNLQSLPRTPPLGSPPPSKRQRSNEEAARHAAIFVGDVGAQLDEVEVDAGAMQLDEVEEVDAGAQLDEVEVDAGAMQLDVDAMQLDRDEVEEVVAHAQQLDEVERAQILTDKDVKHLLDALNYGEITRGGIFQGTLHDYDTNVENLTAVSQGPGCGRGYLQNTIAYTATSLVTNLEVNVSVNFMKKLRQYVERRFRIKAILREFNHVTNKRIRKFLCKRLWHRFNRLWRLITNLDVLADGELPAFEPAFDAVFFDIWGEILCILPADPKSFEFNLAYAVACEPVKYVGAYCALSRLWQAAQFPALFSAIPVRVSHVQSYIPIDTKTLLDVITCPPGCSKLPHSSLEQKLAHWNMLCNVNHKSFRDRGNYKFSGTIMTDGVGVSVRHVDITKVTVTTNGRPVMPKPRKVSKAAQRAAVDRLYVDTPENAAVIRDRILHHPDPNAPVVLCDPNVRDMLYLKEYGTGTDNIMRYTLSQQKKETKARDRVKECNKDRLRNLPAPGGTGSLEATMPGHKSMLSGFRTRQSPRPWRKGHTVGVHGLLGCTSRKCTEEQALSQQWTPDSDLGKRVRYHNRDRASVGNFEHIICEQIVKEGERPAHLSRGDRGKNL
ncbi:hypothetical protein HDU89_001964 [Geranomyces variabilis]|nr:hypothetical protein HDU89_001964 [Geranomyces variabilis]